MVWRRRVWRSVKSEDVEVEEEGVKGDGVNGGWLWKSEGVEVKGDIVQRWRL